jgi:hypothetical protein
MFGEDLRDYGSKEGRKAIKIESLEAIAPAAGKNLKF